jgi:hypothetical protein
MKRKDMITTFGKWPRLVFYPTGLNNQKRIFSPLPVGFFQPTIKTNRMINENYCYGKNNDSKKTKNTLPNQTQT